LCRFKKGKVCYIIYKEEITMPARLIFDEIERLKKENPSIDEMMTDFEENNNILISSLSLFEEEDEEIIFGTDSSY